MEYRLDLTLLSTLSTTQVATLSPMPTLAGSQLSTFWQRRFASTNEDRARECLLCATNTVLYQSHHVTAIHSEHTHCVTLVSAADHSVIAFQNFFKPSNHYLKNLIAPKILQNSTGRESQTSTEYVTNLHFSYDGFAGFGFCFVVKKNELNFNRYSNLLLRKCTDNKNRFQESSICMCWQPSYQPAHIREID